MFLGKRFLKVNNNKIKILEAEYIVDFDNWFTLHLKFLKPSKINWKLLGTGEDFNTKLPYFYTVLPFEAFIHNLCETPYPLL